VVGEERNMVVIEYCCNSFEHQPRDNVIFFFQMRIGNVSFEHWSRDNVNLICYFSNASWKCNSSLDYSLKFYKSTINIYFFCIFCSCKFVFYIFHLCQISVNFKIGSVLYE